MSEDLMAMFRSLQGSLLAHRPHLGAVSERRDCSRVRVVLLTGFLGAGKSTLLAALLADPPGGAVVKAVVNDVGSLPFDPTLMAAQGDLEVELTNGCGCCGDAGDISATLTKLAQSSPDVLVLEASGVADPFALAQIIEADPALVLDRIVAVVSGPSVETQQADPRLAPIVRRQLEAAHVVVVSHADELTSYQRERVTEGLAAIAPGRVIVASMLNEPMITLLMPGSVCGAALPVDIDSLGHQLVTITAQQTSPIASAEIAQVMAAFPAALVRCKGLLRTPAGSVLVQATQSGSQVCEPRAFDRAAAQPWHGLTIVGTDRSIIEQAAGALGCEVAADMSYPTRAIPSR